MGLLFRVGGGAYICLMKLSANHHYELDDSMAQAAMHGWVYVRLGRVGTFSSGEGLACSISCRNMCSASSHPANLQELRDHSARADHLHRMQAT